jgi:DNA-binding Lrp family transcriptional regulator
MQAIVSLVCEGTMDADEVRGAVENHPEVVGAYTVAGEASAVLLVRASDTGHLERLLERLREHRGVLRTQTQIVLSTLFERPLRLDGPEGGAKAP